MYEGDFYEYLSDIAILAKFHSCRQCVKYVTVLPYLIFDVAISVKTRHLVSKGVLPGSFARVLRFSQLGKRVFEVCSRATTGLNSRENRERGRESSRMADARSRGGIFRVAVVSFLLSSFDSTNRLHVLDPAWSGCKAADVSTRLVSLRNFTHFTAAILRVSSEPSNGISDNFTS